MLKLRQFLLATGLCGVVCLLGCGPQAGTGHKDDPTPGGEPTAPAEEMFDPSAFDDYTKTQGGVVDPGTKK